MLFGLYVVQGTFKLITSKAFNQPEIQSFFDRMLKPNLQSPIIELRREAVKGLVLAAIMNKVELVGSVEGRRLRFSTHPCCCAWCWRRMRIQPSRLLPFRA